MEPGYIASLAAMQPFLAMAASFALPLISLILKRREIWEAFALTVCSINFILSLMVLHYLYAISSKPLLYAFGSWPPPIGIVYTIDLAASLMGLLINGLVLAAAIFSIRYMEHENGVQWYYTLLLGFEAGMLGCVYTGDIFNLFVMLEVMSLAAYGLVAFRRETHEAVEAAIKYAIVGSVATTAYFIAVTFAYGAFGTLNMADLALKLRGSTLPVTGSPVGDVFLGSAIFLALTFWAFTLKAAVAPNHFWLPDAHPAAPSPISALLSGIMVKVALFALMRYLFTIFRGAPPTIPIIQIIDYATIALGLLSTIIGSTLMLTQRDIKRLIAYGTILNVGYIAMGMGLANISGLAAALFHLMNHAVGKALLFMAAGAFIHAAGTRSFDELAGVGRRMPLTSATFLVGALALAGAPPLSGFMSKLLLFKAYLESGWLAPIVVVIVVTSVFALMGYLKAFYHVYAKQPIKDVSLIKEAPTSMVAPLLVLAALCVVFGLAAPLIVDNIIVPAVQSLFDTQGYVSVSQEMAKLIMGGG
ncbi:MAG: proton-conducting transporter membrane subunit [Candidatus Nezhaarchaeota archaeon]|nr:cation:proton antiporter [Candidatus Nezhaarchaeota archaeon]MCX8142324.1 proton-conducting transporter membrane subunit [Candidatus Nezhaarchaeota archaeon]MDW8050703.1 proton-conducting transporter membrane subunit [Nitrososphaerota archaeon]